MIVESLVRYYDILAADETVKISNRVTAKQMFPLRWLSQRMENLQILSISVLMERKNFQR